VVAVPDEGSFDTSLRGAPESTWASWAQLAPDWIPAAGPLVIVAPHPDDETLGAGGLIFTWAEKGLPITLISVTDGEAACPEVGDLAAIRRLELAGALLALGCLDVEHIRLEIRDGAVALREDELSRAVASHVSNDAILIAPFEFDGHPDHEATGRACISAAHAGGCALARYPIWAWHCGSQELFAQSQPRRFLLSPAAQSAKSRAFANFRSQLADRPGGAIVPSHVLEYFTRPYEVFLL
jgi:LmbE family N-acetylglucosaminyl deacetylase